MTYLKAMLAVVVLALAASSQASAVAVCSSCYEGDMSPGAQGDWTTELDNVGMTDGDFWNITGVGEPKYVPGPDLGQSGAVEWRLKVVMFNVARPNDVVWQVRHDVRESQNTGPTWHINIQNGNGQVSGHLSQAWPHNLGTATIQEDVFHIYRVAWKPNGANGDNWDWYFSIDGVKMIDQLNQPSVYYPESKGDDHLLMGTADGNDGLSLDYFRVVKGTYVEFDEDILLPEPATLGLVAMGGALMLRRRRRCA